MKDFACFYAIATNFEHPFSNLQRLYGGDFDAENVQEAASGPLKSHRKPPVTSKFGAFSLQPMRGRL
jgi:hypothetical protein